MPDKVPSFDNEGIARLAKDLYGLEGEVSPLVSFEDQNAKIKTPSATYVLKIANTKWSYDYLKMQSDVLEYLNSSPLGQYFPNIVSTLDGDKITYIDGFAVRLLTYLKGDLLHKAPRTPELYQDIGRFLGQLSKTLASYPYPVAEGSDPEWNLDNVMACKKYLPDVTDLDAKDRVERLYAEYEKSVLPKILQLRKTVIHGDPNEQNILVAADQSSRVAGLIDFGEVQKSSQINDLAIALAYGLLGESDIAMASGKIIDGYHSEFPIQPEEREILYYLVAMRLVTNITMTSHNAKLFPDNEYILISQKPARALLKKLEEEKYILA